MGALRSIAFWIFTVLWTVAVLLPGALVSLLSLGLLRQQLLHFFGPLWGKPILWVAGLKLDVRGWEQVARPAARIILFNHSSFLEAPAVMAMSIPHVTFLGKRSFAWIPVLGQAWWLMGGHFIDRGHARKAHASIAALGRDMRRRRLSAWLAPEGTRSRDGKLQPFKLGAFHMALDTGAPVLPVVFHGMHQRLPADSWRVTPGVVRVDFHAPRASESWTRPQLRGIADALHQDYERWLRQGPSLS